MCLSSVPAIQNLKSKIQNRFHLALVVNMKSTFTLGCNGSFDLIVTDLECSPGAVPVSTFTLIVPALPGERTFGKSTVVHPQLGSTAAMLSGAFPPFRMVIVRARLVL